MSEYIEYLREVFAPLGAVQPRKMFGGHGIFYDGVMIALVADDSLYLKIDKQTEGEFIALELPPFEYEKNGKTFAMSYRLAPESMYDDPDDALAWGRMAYEAALRAKKK